MTKKEFKEKTGHEPEQDDLARVNCIEAGTIGHSLCGWCNTHDTPRFMCGCLGTKY